MSTLKTNNAQIGQSATATNNMTWYQPSVPDGTVRLGVGNSGATTADAITVTNAGNATLLGNLTVSGAGTSTFAGTLNATTALQSGGIAAERIVQGTAVATTSGTAVGITGIPSWVKRITFQIINVGVTVGGASQIQVGSGAYVTSGYSYSRTTYTSGTTINNTTNSTGFLVGGATSGQQGFAILQLIDSTTNLWGLFGNGGWGTTVNSFCQGAIALSGPLDRIRYECTPSGGTFNAGSINIIYEG